MLVVKNRPANAGDQGPIPESGRSPGKENCNPFQYSWLENSMDRGAWWATVYGVTKSWTWLKWLSIHTILSWNLPQLIVFPLHQDVLGNLQLEILHYTLWIESFIFPSTFVYMDSVVLTWGLYSLARHILQSLEAFTVFVTCGGGLCLASSPITSW